MRRLSIPRTWRHLKRYNQVISVLIKYGFSDLVEVARKDLITRFGEKFIPHGRKSKLSGLARHERIRLAVEELGPTFIKLGQILSLRPDIIPAEIAAELTFLQDRVSPLSFDIIEKEIRAELQCEPEKVFSEIDPNPLAAASIAQVHKGVLLSGEPVALKVQRPGSVAMINTDIEILDDLAAILQHYFLEKFAQDPVAIINEFDRSIHQELDFIQEGRNIKRFRRYFAGDEIVFIPNYYGEYSTARLLIMDLVEGVKASDIDLLEANGIDRRIVAQRGVQISFRQIFEFGFFHADPHPGNIMVLPGNVIAPLDFGMVGQIDETTIDTLGDVVLGVLRKDVTRTLRALEDLTDTELQHSAYALRIDISALINNYSDIPLKELQLSSLMEDFYNLIRKYRLKIPPHLALMLKALVTVEGLARILYPDFDLMAALKPYVQKIVKRRYDPRRLVRNGASILNDFSNLVTDLPRQLRAIVGKAADGNFTIQFQHRNLEHLIDEVARASSQLSLALVLAALIVGSSLVIQTAAGPKLFGYSLIGVIGFFIAAIIGLKMLWDRFGNRRK
ncbi:MAG: AarF/UbiB family protein [Candidatus Neomarinimicrobiota bacterium]